MGYKKQDYYKLQSGNRTGAEKWEKSQGIFWEHEGFDLFLEKVEGSYKITEGRTGLLVVSDIWKTLTSVAKAKEDFAITLEKWGGVEELKARLDDCVRRRGLSPLYQNEKQENVA